MQATSPAGDGRSCIGDTREVVWEWAQNGEECIGCIS